MASSQASHVVARPSDAELLQAQADLWRLSLSYLTPLSLRCAVQLGIPTAIHRLGGAASPSDLIAALPLPSAKLPFLHRLLRLLAVAGVFTAVHDETAAAAEPEEARYRINPMSYLLVAGGNVPHDVHMDHTASVLTCTSARCVEAAMGLAEWFKTDVVTPPFVELHGAALFHESMDSLDAEYHAMANESLDAHDNFGNEIALREFRDVFEGASSVTHVCGACGDDKFPRAVVKAFPHIKCTVLAPPNLIAAKPSADDDAAGIKYVEGDMFSFVPPAQVVVLKLVLNHWTDEECVEILAQCRKAVPSRKDGGKVIVSDIMIDYSSPMLEAHLLMDMGMMTMTKGKQRDENEWRDLFLKAGFSDYKILKEIGVRVAFEVYP